MLKKRFKILDRKNKTFFTWDHQRGIFESCCALHNYLNGFEIDEHEGSEDAGDDVDDSQLPTVDVVSVGGGTAADLRLAAQLRRRCITDVIWEDFLVENNTVPTQQEMEELVTQLNTA
jgi:hypothetical protein